MRRTVLWIAVAAVAAAWTAHANEADAKRAVISLLRHADSNEDGQVTFDELLESRPQTTPEEFARWDSDDDNALTAADALAHVRDAKGRLTLDFDGDGKVSLEEAKKALPGLTDEAFDRLDYNDDGELSGADQRGDGRDARVRNRLHRADLDGNGRVTYQEARQEEPEMTEARFNQLDVNGDGYLTWEDFKRDRESIRTRLQRADTNNDRKVTYAEAQAEFPNLDRTMFDKFDANGDGELTTIDVLMGALNGNDTADD